MLYTMKHSHSFSGSNALPKTYQCLACDINHCAAQTEPSESLIMALQFSSSLGNGHCRLSSKENNFAFLIGQAQGDFCFDALKSPQSKLLHRNNFYLFRNMWVFQKGHERRWFHLSSYCLNIVTSFLLLDTLDELLWNTPLKIDQNNSWLVRVRTMQHHIGCPNNNLNKSGNA